MPAIPNAERDRHEKRKPFSSRFKKKLAHFLLSFMIEKKYFAVFAKNIWQVRTRCRKNVYLCSPKGKVLTKKIFSR
jgi:hypothetical protein